MRIMSGFVISGTIQQKRARIGRTRNAGCCAQGHVARTTAPRRPPRREGHRRRAGPVGGQHPPRSARVRCGGTRGARLRRSASGIARGGRLRAAHGRGPGQQGAGRRRGRSPHRAGRHRDPRRRHHGARDGRRDPARAAVHGHHAQSDGRCRAARSCRRRLPHRRTAVQALRRGVRGRGRRGRTADQRRPVLPRSHRRASDGGADHRGSGGGGHEARPRLPRRGDLRARERGEDRDGLAVRSSGAG